MTNTSQPKTARFDLQGALTNAERERNAQHTFLKDFTRDAAAHLDACVHCGLCAEACHFYVTTEDPKYTPIRKLEHLRDAYRAEAGAFAPLKRLFGLGNPKDLAVLEESEELLYDSCTMCGRCTLICPMGIDIAELIERARHGMYEAGLVPDRLQHIVRNAELNESPFGTPEHFIETIRAIEDKFDYKLALDKGHADVLVTLTPEELEHHNASVVGTARILDRAGIDYTLSSQAYEATNFGYLSGNLPLQRELTMRIIDHAASIGAKTLILPECGHAYGAARWEAGRWYPNGNVPVEVLHIVEYMDALIADELIKLNKLSDTATFHYPCQQFRRGGLKEQPRRILDALGLELYDMEPSNAFSYCCGGGGGVVSNGRADDLRRRVFEMKRNEVENTGANRFVTSCGICSLTFEKGAKAAGWDRMPESLVELVAAQLTD